jgi:hypothetical protein
MRWNDPSGFSVLQPAMPTRGFASMNATIPASVPFATSVSSSRIST